MPNASHLARLEALTSGNLDPDSFRHRDHIGVAYEALSRHDFFEAAARVASSIRRLAEKAGAPEKFNATITLAFMSLIAERMATTVYCDAEDFIVRNPDLACGGVLKPWYSDQRLKSDLARSILLLPDRALAAG